MEFLIKILAVALGGAFGATARFGMNLFFTKTFAPFPFATFFINVSGSFLMGFLAVVCAEKFAVGENFKLFLFVGMLGAYTTFSTFELETFELMRQKHLTTAIFYVSASFAVGLIGVIGGFWLAKKII